ncbi:hypothetical protein D9611_006205 [Ephemerocybe angulata]|uniref:Histone H2A n=1 Tax=Ephemerocybe angulata TaxID=980116 RepID=A0A8H5C771_9AGAR|nr:hypothetical protein D9611_006205 [Tulosesus angulatus]
MKNSTWPGGSGERRRSLKTAAVYLAAVLEYLVAELIETSGWEAIKEQKKRITPRYVMLAVNHDKEMLALLPQGKVIIAQAGVGLKLLMNPSSASKPAMENEDKESKEE